MGVEPVGIKEDRHRDTVQNTNSARKARQQEALNESRQRVVTDEKIAQRKREVREQEEAAAEHQVNRERGAAVDITA